jgi:PAS domain S-box-containing protein
MDTEKINILLVEDNEGDARLVKEHLHEMSSINYVVDHVTHFKNAIERLGAHEYALILLDLGLPDSAGFQTFNNIQLVAGEVPIIILTGLGDEELSIKAVKAGAQDYLVKGHVDSYILSKSIRYAIERKNTEKNILRLTKLLKAVRNVNRLVTDEKDRDKLLHGICNQLSETHGYENVWILLTNAKGRALSYIRAYEPTLSPEAKRLALNKGEGFPCIMTPLPEGEITILGPGSPTCEKCPMKAYEMGCNVMMGQLRIGERNYGALAVLISMHHEIGDEERTLFREVCGEISHALYVMDIENERKRTYEELESSEEKFKMIFNNASDAMFILDFKGRFLEVNKVAWDRLEYTHEELLNMSPEDISRGYEMQRVLKQITNVSDDRGIVFESSHITRTGKVIPVEVAVRRILYDGNPAGLCTVRDLTERKRITKIQNERSRSVMCGFLASSIPVFASSIPAKLHDLIITSFAERFEKNMMPKFKESVVESVLSEESDEVKGSAILEEYIKWTSDLFMNFGIDVRTQSANGCQIIEFGSCPWQTEGHGNPIYCLLCKTMVTKSFTWTGLDGSINQIKSIADGAHSCQFDIKTPKEKEIAELEIEKSSAQT